MILKRTKYLIYLAFCSILAVSSCKDAWDEHLDVTQSSLNESLTESIEGNADLSRFAELLKVTHYDEVLSSSKQYTVWAPSNDAINALSAEFLADTAKVRQFVAFHISSQSYLTSTPADSSIRVLTLSGKYATFSKTAYDDITITDANKLSRNGVLHTINQADIPALNIWEYVKANTNDYKQNKFVSSLDTTMFDATKAKQIGVDSKTGEPVYEAGSGLVTINKFLTKVANVSNEAGTYTYFVLANSAYDSEYNKISKYFYTESSNADSSTSYLTQLNVVKDLVVKGVYTKSNLPDTLISLFNVKIPINKSSIIASYKASNGIVHVLGSMNFKVSDKIPTIVVQGESPYSFSASRTSNIYYRTKLDSLGGTFSDIEAYGHGVSLYNIQYRIFGVPSVTYKVYWRAVAGALGDSQTATFQQRLNFGTATSNTFPYTTVALRNYYDVYLGDYTQAKYGTLNMFLVSAASTSTGVNTLILDYVKMVPVLN